MPVQRSCILETFNHFMQKENAKKSTRDKGKMSTVEMQIAERARKYPAEALTNLHQFIDEEFLHECYGTLNRQSASGVDRQTWAEYDELRKERIPQLVTAFKKGDYKAPNIRRVYIPKEDGKQRPLGLPTMEDKLLQTAVYKVLTPIYEQLFYDCSYGFRPGKSQHQALDKLFEEVSFKGKRYIIDADIKNYFGSIDHVRLREVLDLKIKDGVIRKMIDKWLKAGIQENAQVSYPTEGTPQGGSISPLLSNIFLHYVLDEWFSTQIQPLLKRTSFIIRFADDFLLGFTNEEDAKRVMDVLPKRFEKYGINLHPDKTKLIALNQKENSQEQATFDFLGFTHYMNNSRKGKRILKRKTSKKKLRGALIRMNKWIRENRHSPFLEGLIADLNRKLRGYYRYYGITFNSRSIYNFHDKVKQMLFKWVNRRGAPNRLTWEQFNLRVEVWSPLEKPRIYHKYLLAKP